MIYTYQCTECGARQEKSRKVAHRHASVTCDCGGYANLAITPVAINTSGCTFDAFQAHGVAGRPVVTNERQRKEMMAKHDLLDANETFTPPTHAEQKREHENAVESATSISNRDGLAVADIL